MAEMTRHGVIGQAAMRAGMDRKTARRYVKSGQIPSAMRPMREYRTRDDPFDEDWPWIVERLQDAPDLQATVILDHLMERRPDRYHPGQVRTLQRRLKKWRAQEGPEKELFFPQAHRPGEAMQSDFTHCSDLGVTIAGAPFPHGLQHAVLPYSNWEWATIGFSESMETLRAGIQAAVFRLGKVPSFHQTDHSTAATHAVGSGERGFNVAYLELMEHLGMTPRTIAVGKKEQNGDVEASHGAFKRRLDQELLFRGSRDFESTDVYERFVVELMERRNRQRRKKLEEELSVMRPIRSARLPEFTEIEARVTSGGTLRIKRNTYSVPSRLKGERVKVRIHARTVEVYHGQRQVFATERLLGEGKSRIDYRHVIRSLIRKPGAFDRYRYRDELFPSAIFKDAYERLHDGLDHRKADIHYLRILLLAAETRQHDVELALEPLLSAQELPTVDAVRESVDPREPEVPDLEVLPVDLDSYDELLSVAREVVR